MGGAVSVTPAPSQSGAGSEPCLLALALLRGCVGEVVPPLLLRVWGQPSQPPARGPAGPLLTGVLLRAPDRMHFLSPESQSPLSRGAVVADSGVPLSILIGFLCDCSLTWGPWLVPRGCPMFGPCCPSSSLPGGYAPVLDSGKADGRRGAEMHPCPPAPTTTHPWAQLWAWRAEDEFCARA